MGGALHNVALAEAYLITTVGMTNLHCWLASCEGSFTQVEATSLTDMEVEDGTHIHVIGTSGGYVN